MELMERALSAISEAAQIDFKKDFNPNLPKEWVEIVKDIVAMANSGGGVILFGVDNYGTPVANFDADAVARIDPADITNKIYKYTGYHFGDFEIVKRKKDGKEIVIFVINKAETPMVFSSPGTYSIDNRKQKTAFAKGTIYFRHGAKSEPATREDLQQWLQNVRQEAQKEILERIQTVATLPVGVPLQIVPGAGEPIDTPTKLLANAVQRREREPNHLLSSQELLWIFQQRHHLNINKAELLLLVGSGLRRSSTLYWWLQLMERKYDAEPILSEIQGALDASDRDKSDAARNIVDVAAIYASDNLLQEIVSRLRDSRYAHFREVGKAFTSREDILRKFHDRLVHAKHDGNLLLELSPSTLENIATDVASDMIMRSKIKSSDSRRLGNITRTLWYINSTYAQKLFKEITHRLTEVSRGKEE